MLYVHTCSLSSLLNLQSWAFNIPVHHMFIHTCSMISLDQSATPPYVLARSRIWSGTLPWPKALPACRDARLTFQFEWLCFWRFFLNCFVHRSSKPIKTIRTPKDLLAPVPDAQICLDSASLGFSGRAEPPSPEAFRAGAQDCAVWDPRDPSWRWLPRKVMQNDMLSQHKWI